MSDAAVTLPDGEGNDARDVAAEVRDRAAVARDAAAGLRDDVDAGPAETCQERSDRDFAAADRAAAALDREEAARDRKDAATLLQNSYRDHLTGALLRHAGSDVLRKSVARSHRDGTTLTVAFVDVDHLKEVNEASGHAAGDAVLGAVGDALERGLRAYDVVVRYGGDEFVCGLPGISLADAEHRFEHLHSILAESPVDASISVGFAELVSDESLDALVARADVEMYAGRRARRAAGRAATGK